MSGKKNYLQIAQIHASLTQTTSRHNFHIYNLDLQLNACGILYISQRQIYVYRIKRSDCKTHTAIWSSLLENVAMI